MAEAPEKQAAVSTNTAQSWQIGSWLLGAILGLAVLLNQCGQGLAAIIPELDRYSILSSFWRVNYKVGNAEGLHALSVGLIVLFLLNLVAWIRHPSEEARGSYILGILVGLVVFPTALLCLASILLALPVAIAVIAGIGYALYWLSVNLALPLLAFLAIPLIWLWEHTLGPIFWFILSPIIWIWESIVLPILELVFNLFKWVWENIFYPVIDFLQPVASWLFEYILVPVLKFIVTVLLKWLLIIALSILAVVACTAIILGSFGAVWRVILEGFRSAIWGKFGPQIAFNSGVGIGLLLFDLLVAYGMDLFTEYSFAPSISHFILLIPAIYFAVRVIRSRFTSLPSFESNKFTFYWRNYWRDSRLELYVFVAAFPLFILITLASKASEPDA